MVDLMNEVPNIVAENVVLGGQERAVVAPVVDTAALGVIVRATKCQGRKQLTHIVRISRRKLRIKIILKNERVLEVKFLMRLMRLTNPA